MFVKTIRVSANSNSSVRRFTDELYRLETGYCGFGDTCKFLHDRGTCELGI